jgi:predicted dehydrogenase
VHRVEVGLGGGYSDYAGTKDKQTAGPPPPELDYDFWLGPAPWAPYCPARVHKNWRWHMDYGGGRIMDWVGHHIDIAHWGLDLDGTGPVEVEGRGKYPTEGVWNAATEYEFTCKYADGLQLVSANSFADGTKWYGDKGWVHVDRGRLDANPRSVLNEVIGPDEVRLYKSRDHLQNFLDCVKSRRQTITPCEVAHRSASVGHLAVIAIRVGRKIRFNPETEQILGDPTADSLLGKPMRSPWHI